MSSSLHNHFQLSVGDGRGQSASPVSDGRRRGAVQSSALYYILKTMQAADAGTRERKTLPHKHSQPPN